MVSTLLPFIAKLNGLYRAPSCGEKLIKANLGCTQTLKTNYLCVTLNYVNLVKLTSIDYVCFIIMYFAHTVNVYEALTVK